MQTSIAAEVLRLCRERGLTLAAAESCTGGLIAKELTDIPGASQVFLGGVVSYTNHVKEQVLRVPAALLERCGAVSAPVARAMAAPEGVFVEQLALGGDRAQIRALSAHHALDMARRYLTHQMTEGE